MSQSRIKCLPIIPEPAEYGVCKEYLVFLLEVMEMLEVQHTFVHADEQMCRQ